MNLLRLVLKNFCKERQTQGIEKKISGRFSPHHLKGKWAGFKNCFACGLGKKLSGVLLSAGLFVNFTLTGHVVSFK
jgi:hypothetical protein